MRLGRGGLACLLNEQTPHIEKLSSICENVVHFMSV